uniref:Uncharacterized protein n=1 Tax=Meloidogyne enterolobii TaxID=390850 RepID=A0A6V7U428_MELEN|nr:unnamed protein product [Meloidogyne enterolobii]
MSLLRNSDTVSVSLCLQHDNVRFVISLRWGESSFARSDFRARSRVLVSCWDNCLNNCLGYLQGPV